MDQAASGQPFLLRERVHFRYEAAQVVDRCSALVTRILHACGASGTKSGTPIVRAFLDIHTARTHVANDRDRLGRNYGGVLLGAPNLDTFL